MGVFSPDFYRRYRPFYPPATFAGLADRLRERGFAEPFAIADIGCGTGHSTTSLLETGLRARISAIDPDPGMLAQAKAVIADRLPAAKVELIEGSGEATSLPDASVDAAIVGSAFHWMNGPKAAREMSRILKPRGTIRIFEYQFPKALDLPELNEYIRRQFNLLWKAPAQVPRGRFCDVTKVFRTTPGWEFLGEANPPMTLLLSPEEFFGLVLSQSRVHHYEASLTIGEQESFRRELEATLHRKMDGIARKFSLKLEWVEFGRTNGSEDQ